MNMNTRDTESRRGKGGWFVFPLRGGQRISLNIFPTSKEVEEWINENSED